MASYQELIQYFQNNVPTGNVAPHSTDWNNRFNQWIGGIMADIGAESWDQVPVAALDQYEVVDQANPTGPALNQTEDVPLEQGILDQTLPRLLDDIERDEGRATLADQLGSQAQADYEAARNLLSPEENARRLQEEYAMADQTANTLSQSAATSAQEQLQALQAAIASMQGNLSGELAQRAAALQQQLASLNGNLDQFNQAQLDALATQITEQTANLQTSITDRQAALATEIEALRGAADAESVARRAALETEIAGLTSAQEPLNQARLASANAQSTAINLALEGERDRLTAENAMRGYLGGSSFENQGLARAAIGARQGAAQALAGAREANATDTRTIQSRAATEGRTLADQLASNNSLIAQRQATGTRSLADELAMGNRTIADAGSAGRAGIAVNTANQRMGINNAGANQTFQDQVFGAGQQRAIADQLAQNTASVAQNRATQQQAARDQGTTQRQGYFDNAYTRGLGGTAARVGMSESLTNTLTGLDNYANSGLGRSLGTLNWWTGSAPQAQTPGYVPVQPSQVGNDIAGLGAGLLGAGLSLGTSLAGRGGSTYKGIPVVNTPGTASSSWWGGSNVV